MDLPFPVYLIGLRGLLVLLVLLLLGASFFLNLSLLLREPAPWQVRFFRLIAGAAVVAFVTELLVRTLFMGGRQVACGVWAFGDRHPLVCERSGGGGMVSQEP